MAWFEGFEGALHPVGEVELFVRTGGNPAGRQRVARWSKGSFGPCSD